MTTINFALSRAAAREFEPGDEIVVTRLDHDGSIAPWLELARDRELVVRFADVDEGCQVDLADLERQLSDRTRVVAFPLASNAVGTITDAERIVDLAHARRRARLGGRRPLCGPSSGRCHRRSASTCSSARRTSSTARISASPSRAGSCSSAGGRTRSALRPSPRPGRRYETGTAAHELLAGFVAAVGYVESIGWDTIAAQERALGERFIAGLPERCRLYGPPTMDGRVSTFGFTVEGHTPLKVSEALGLRDVAVQYGDFYAFELPRRLELPDGLVRAGILHYNTADEVDRLLAGLDELV